MAKLHSACTDGKTSFAVPFTNRKIVYSLYLIKLFPIFIFNNLCCIITEINYLTPLRLFRKHKNNKHMVLFQGGLLRSSFKNSLQYNNLHNCSFSTLKKTFKCKKVLLTDSSERVLMKEEEF